MDVMDVGYMERLQGWAWTNFISMKIAAPAEV
jgi:hypothetical protein